MTKAKVYFKKKVKGKYKYFTKTYKIPYKKVSKKRYDNYLREDIPKTWKPIKAKIYYYKVKR
jgi:hypothetical protein